MDRKRWEQVKSLFLATLEQPGSAREAFLDSECRGDAALRVEVEELLAAQDREDLPLEKRLLVDDDLVGTHVGRYRVCELLGRGGMGDVYRAKRDDDFDQIVALKLVRPGLHAVEYFDRFRAERQILAHLQHPNIAQLLDGGMTANGQPFLVMAFVDGTPITTYCNATRASVSQRLRLFQTICGAVQFAHQNLVVHRDLKPSNILVTERGDVKLLDFGIAKLLEPGSADDLMPSTGTEWRMMTPDYAAPEQIRGNSITTATDVYALGVLLYELLTNRRPYHLRDKSPAEIERIVCDTTVSLPSTAIGPGRSRRALVGDLDNIVMKAMRKEPERRYATPEQLAEDVGRYLGGHPVIARRDTLFYRTSKFVGRNRITVGATVAFVLLLCVFSAVTASQARRVLHERDRAEQVSGFLATIFEAANPAAAQGDTLTALQLLDRGADRIDSELTHVPAVRADLLDLMSRAYLARAAYDRAAELAREAVALRSAAGSPKLPLSQTRLAEALEAQSRFAEADSLHKLVVAHRRKQADSGALIEALERRGQFLMASLGPNETLKGVFEEALDLRRRHYGTDDPGRGRILFLYAKAHHVTGDYRTAEKLFREALDEQRRFPGDLVVTAQTLGELGPILSFRREHVLADSILREAAELHAQIYGRSHPLTANVLSFLSLNLTSLDRLAEAEELQREALAIQGQHSGVESKDYVTSLRNLRRVLTLQERYDEALEVSREVLRLTEKLYGADSRSYATNLAHFGQVLHNAGKFNEALPVYREALPLIGTTMGSEMPYYATILADLARTLDALERRPEADPLYEQAYETLKAKLAPGNFERSRLAYALGQRRLAAGDNAAALLLFEDAASVRASDSEAATRLAASANRARDSTLMVLDQPAR